MSEDHKEFNFDSFDSFDNSANPNTASLFFASELDQDNLARSQSAPPASLFPTTTTMALKKGNDANLEHSNQEPSGDPMSMLSMMSSDQMFGSINFDANQQFFNESLPPAAMHFGAANNNNVEDIYFGDSARSSAFQSHESSPFQGSVNVAHGRKDGAMTRPATVSPKPPSSRSDNARNFAYFEQLLPINGSARYTKAQKIEMGAAYIAELREYHQNLLRELELLRDQKRTVEWENQSRINRRQFQD